MSDLNDLIHTNAKLAFEQGVKRERERIVSILREYAPHLTTSGLMQQILETDVQQNMHERANNADFVSENDTNSTESARTHELKVDVMVDLYNRLHEVVEEYFSYSQTHLNITQNLYENTYGSDSELRVAQLRQAKELWNVLVSMRNDFESAYFDKLDAENRRYDREKYGNEELH